jgi:UPF0716 protein FxsA
LLVKLLVLFIVVPLVELWLLLLLAQHTTASFTLLVVIVTGVVGTALARSQGWRTYQQIHQQVHEGHLPAEALLDAAMIFVAGALLLTPGILTDLFGLSLLVPFFRRQYRRWTAEWMKRHFRVTTFPPPSPPGSRSRIIDSYVVDEDHEGGPAGGTESSRRRESGPGSGPGV